MKEPDLDKIELATVAFLEMTPSLREQIKLLIPLGSTREQARTYFRTKAWSELCDAAKRAGKKPMEYADQVIELYRADLAQHKRKPPPDEQLA
jgi:hypothetical protein